MNSNWYKIKAAAEDQQKPAEIFIYDDIGAYGTTAADFISTVKNTLDGKALNVRINSLGGSVFDALAIYNFLKSRGNVDTTVDGIAASSASVIAMAGAKRYMPDGAFVMVHNPWNYAQGDATQLREQADMLDQVAGVLATIYSTATGISKADARSMMDSETWMDGKTARAKGFATHDAPGAPAQARVKAGAFRSTPQALVLNAAAPSDLDAGDDVQWDENGTTCFGYILEIERDGVLSLPDLNLSATGTAVDPAALIERYAEIADAQGNPTGVYICTEAKAVANFSQLTEVEDLDVLSNEATENRMKKITEALAKAGIISSATLAEDAAVGEIQAKATGMVGIAQERDNVKAKLADTEKERDTLKIELAQARKDAAEVLVNAAVADGRVKADAKDTWVAKIVADPQAAALLATVTPGRPGGTPLAHSHGGIPNGNKNLTEQCIEANAKAKASGGAR